jgi:hypothetical protein
VWLDLEWRRAVCRHLSSRLNRQTATAQICSRLIPVLQVLYPLPPPHQPEWAGLWTGLQELVDIIRDLRCERDIFSPFFPGKGHHMGSYDMVRTYQTGTILFCTFPGVTKRFWNTQRNGWFESLLTPAIVSLHSVLNG